MAANAAIVRTRIARSPPVTTGAASDEPPQLDAVGARRQERPEIRVAELVDRHVGAAGHGLLVQEVLDVEVRPPCTVRAVPAGPHVDPLVGRHDAGLVVVDAAMPLADV